MAEYSRGILKIVVAQICQVIGWHSINSTPIEFMVDLMQEYLSRTSRLAHQYAGILGRTEVNLNDVGLAFQQMNIDIQQLAEYVKNVDSVPCVIAVPKLSVSADNHLNFLKPGSKEVVTRSVHVHEHLPAMHLEISSDIKEANNNGNIDASNDFELVEEQISSKTDAHSDLIFKRPGNPPFEQSTTNKRTKITDESRPLREIHSVMMTTSGFLSPAREGKLPESRSPVQTRADSPISSLCSPPSTEQKHDKKMKKVVRKGVEARKLDKENKKKVREKELFKPDKIQDIKVKRLTGLKEPSKMKFSKTNGSKAFVNISPLTSNADQYGQKEEIHNKVKRTSPKLKNEKIINNIVMMNPEKIESNIAGKLPVEPDKLKLNIFKKLSKSRDDKNSELLEHSKAKEIDMQYDISQLNSSEINYSPVYNDTEIKDKVKTSPSTQENNISLNNEISELRSPSLDVYMFDDMSPPGTPSTPKTPELSVPGCANDQKKKKKDKNNRKRDMKNFNVRDNTNKGKQSSEVSDADLLGRPKTPDASESSPRKDSNITSGLSFPFFPAFPSAPGLIPHPIHHAMFPRFPLPLPRGQANSQNLSFTPRFPPPAVNTRDMLLMNDKLLDRDAYSANNSEQMIFTESGSNCPKIEVEKSSPINKCVKHHTLPPPHFSEIPTPQYEIFRTGMFTSDQLPSQKLIKPDKNDKKSKKHKIEKREKLKKKKDKKDKHKEKIEKNKGKRERLEKVQKIKERKEKRDKRKDKNMEKESEAVPKITLKLGTATPSPPMLETSLKKITIKPLIKKGEDVIKRESSPELAKISALITRPPKQKTARMKHEATSRNVDLKDENTGGERGGTETLGSATIDSSGHQVWICPACGNQDDGSPMIGCDDCDAWYHWVCVGMQVPPATNEDWYCRLCIAKKQGLHHDKKRKKRKKKVKFVN